VFREPPSIDTPASKRSTVPLTTDERVTSRKRIPALSAVRTCGSPKTV